MWRTSTPGDAGVVVVCSVRTMATSFDAERQEGEQRRVRYFVATRLGAAHEPNPRKAATRPILRRYCEGGVLGTSSCLFSAVVYIKGDSPLCSESLL
jgi:hypothetical protein